MLRKFLIIFMSLSLCWTTIACGSSNQSQVPNQPNQQNNTAPVQSKLSDGKYSVQQATYDDANGSYSLMLLNANPPVYNTEQLQMQRLTDEEMKAGEKTYLQVENNQPVMHLTEDFKIEYVHNVTETQTNPQTGQTETVVVRQQSGFWAPFAGALAGQAIGSLLFRPQYYVPPVYQPGVVLNGYGGYGTSYSQAVDSYRTRYKSQPLAVKNRQVLRTTGNIRRNRTSTTTFRKSPNRDRSTGSGFGSSKLRSSGKTYTRSRSSFGSGGRSRSTSGFGSRRRR